MSTPRRLRRFLIVAAALASLVLIDGIVLAATNGLGQDATPVFPVLGGSFSKTRNSGTSLIILGILMELVTLTAWLVLSRRARQAQQRAGGSPAARAVEPGGPGPGHGLA